MPKTKPMSHAQRKALQREMGNAIAAFEDNDEGVAAQVAFGHALGLSKQRISQLKNAAAWVPADIAMDIEWVCRERGRTVLCENLRKDSRWYVLTSRSDAAMAEAQAEIARLRADVERLRKGAAVEQDLREPQ